MTTTMQSLIELPDDLVTAIKSSVPDLALQIHAYHMNAHQETLLALANLSETNENFAQQYRYLKELNKAHEAATNTWSN